MLIIHKISELKSQLQHEREQGHTIGLVPTMGALHDGHASLVKRSVSENDVTVVSIFLNPTQFNDKKDLERYPRTLEADCKLLEECGAQIAFAPSVEEIYPEPDTRSFSYPPTDSVMEGAMRPGHFNGVCQIVSKLFDYTNPDRVYLGEKDYQQIAVIKRMVDDLGFKLTIVPCPVIREESGLAMSSRNTLLTDNERAIAANIYKVLKKSTTLGINVKQTHDYVVEQINAVEGALLKRKLDIYEELSGKLEALKAVVMIPENVHEAAMKMLKEEEYKIQVKRYDDRSIKIQATLCNSYRS